MGRPGYSAVCSVSTSTIQNPTRHAAVPFNAVATLPYLDIYLVNGAGMPSLAKEGPQHKNRLFHNNGDLTFTDVTDKAGLGGAGYGMGAAVGDYDNDGRPDLL